MTIGCNTSAEQSFLARWTVRDSVDPLNQIDWSNPAMFPGPVNISSVVMLWVLVQAELWKGVISPQNKSAYHLILRNNGLSSVQFSYSGKSFVKSGLSVY